MAYDNRLDEQLFAKSWQGKGTVVTVGVYSYNGGAKKLQISRQLVGESGQPEFAKLGRLTKEEVEAIVPFLQEAIALMA